MIGTFACPECGSGVSPRAGSPGRRVRCAGCGTLVEVPFLPRVARSRQSRGRWGWRLAGGGLAVAVLMVVLAVNVARSRGHAARVERLHAQMEAVDRAEA